MKQIVIPVDREQARRVDALGYEVQARKQVIAFYLDRGMDTGTEQFARYQREYVEQFVAWEQAKNELVQTCLSGYPDRRRWWLDSGRGEIRLELGP